VGESDSPLFEAITQLPEYYPTRTEIAILPKHCGEISDFCGASAVLIEYGTGAALKTEILLNALLEPRLTVPIDIAGVFTDLTVARLQNRFVNLLARPIVRDFTPTFALLWGSPVNIQLTTSSEARAVNHFHSMA
jgi:L-histidine N-alpha-methyltransferase